MHDGSYMSKDTTTQQLQQTSGLEMEDLGHDVWMVTGLVAGKLLLHGVADLRPVQVTGDGDKEISSSKLADVR